MGGVTLSVEGADLIKQAFAEISKGISDRALLDLHKEAAKIAKKAVLANAPAKRLRKAKTVKIVRARGKDRTAVNVG